MKAVLSISMLVVGIVSFASQAQAENNIESTKQVQSQQAFLPRGGWDGNNLRVSVSQTRLLAEQKVETSVRGGGWDLNNLRISASHSKLLGAQK